MEMTKQKALLIINRMIENLEQSNDGEELDFALETSGFWRGDVKEALKCLERLHE